MSNITTKRKTRCGRHAAEELLLPTKVDKRAHEINTIWDRGIEAIVSVGWIIAEARIRMSPKGWQAFILDNCAFDLVSALSLLRTVQGKHVTNRAIEQGFPAMWHRLFDLIRLDEATFRAGVNAGVITPTCTWEQIHEFRKMLAAKERAAAKASQRAAAKPPKGPGGRPKKTTDTSGARATALLDE